MYFWVLKTSAGVVVVRANTALRAFEIMKKREERNGTPGYLTSGKSKSDLYTLPESEEEDVVLYYAT